MGSMGQAPRSRSKRPERFRFVGALVLLLALVMVTQGALRAASSYDWPQFDGNAEHTGNNTQEMTISTSNVASLQQLFRVSLPAVADGTPAYLAGVSTAGGTRDLLFLTTKDGHILALDAHSGAVVWSHQSGPGSCTIPTGGACFTTSSPAADPNRQYVYSYGLDGYVHKYRVGDGTEITGTGWPELATKKPNVEKGSSALAVAATGSGGYLYVANGGYPGDLGDYQGHVTAINLGTGSQHVFNMPCSNQVDVHFVQSPGTPDCSQVQSAVWARAGVVYDPDTNKIYFVTGNGTYAPGSFAWGESVLALNPDGTGSTTTVGNPLDSYTPANYQQLTASDTDLGSTAPAILPVPSSSAFAHVAVQGGKDGDLRLLNLDNLSGQGGPGHTSGEIGIIPLPSTILAEILSQPAVWTNPADATTWVFVNNNLGIAGLRLTVSGSGTPGLQTLWSTALTARGFLGSSPLVANGVLFDARNNLIEARDPVSGRQLWHDTSIGGIHWEHPVVANGMLYITDESGQLTAYGLPSAPSDTPTSTATPSTTSGPTETPTPALTNTPTDTPVPATNTPTDTPVPVTNTPTDTPVPATETSTATPAPTDTPTPTGTLTPSPTDTPTPMPTSTPTASTQQLVVNGGFENGQSPWQEASGSGSPLISSVQAHTGTYSAALCGYTKCNDQIWQTVTLPSSFAHLTLSYWVYVDTTNRRTFCSSSFTGGMQTSGGVTISSTSLPCNDTPLVSWVQRSVDLTAALQPYAGQTVQVVFRGTTNASHGDTVYLDDVALAASL